MLNYGGAADTLTCLAWLRSLAGCGAHVVVVDNASPDDSIAVIREAYPDVEIVALSRNFGFSGGNNRGMAEGLRLIGAKGEAAEFVWLVNNDTCGDPDALERLEALADADDRIGAVGSTLVRPGSRDVESRGTRLSDWLCLTWRRRRPTEPVDGLCGASILLRAAALREVGLLDETFFFGWEDAELSRRLSRAGWRLAVADRSIVEHKDGATAAAASPFRVRHHVRGMVIYSRRVSPVPWFSATFAAMLCAANCCLRRGQPALLGAVRGGFYDGWRSKLLPMPAWPDSLPDGPVAAGGQHPP